MGVHWCKCDRSADERPSSGVCRRCGGLWPEGDLGLHNGEAGYVAGKGIRGTIAAEIREDAELEADRVRSVLDVLSAYGVRSFEGCGIKVEFAPPAQAESKSAPPSLASQLEGELRSLESILKGRAA